MIFYFTGTGNCLHVARELAEADVAAGGTGGVTSVPQEMRREGELSYKDGAIGLVYPIYGHMMPAMVRQFLERATFDTPYFYIVCTYGNRHANAVELAQEQARALGIDPAYITTLLMVDNWLPAFDMDEQRSRIPEKRIGENHARIAADIAARKRWIEPVTDADRAAHAQFLSRGLRFEPEDLGDFLRIDARACVGCGVCARVCPAGCIAFAGEGRDRVAARDSLAGLGCNACLACIHACPHGAIGLPAGEKNPAARFRNEHVSLVDLCRANGA